MQVVAVTVAVVLIGLSVWYRFAVVPELTALEYELWVVGTDNDLVIEVDIESDLVLVTNVPSGLPDMVVGDQAVYVRPDTPGASAEAVEWVAAPARCAGRADFGGAGVFISVEPLVATTGEAYISAGGSAAAWNVSTVAVAERIGWA